MAECQSRGGFDGNLANFRASWGGVFPTADTQSPKFYHIYQLLLTQFIVGKSMSLETTTPLSNQDSDIAIVGMSAHLPGASTLPGGGR